MCTRIGTWKEFEVMRITLIIVASEVCLSVRLFCSGRRRRRLTQKPRRRRRRRRSQRCSRRRRRRPFHMQMAAVFNQANKWMPILVLALRLSAANVP